MTLHHNTAYTGVASDLQRREIAESIKNPRAQVERAKFEAYRQLLRNYRKHLEN